jgi:hypothetical protein
MNSHPMIHLKSIKIVYAIAFIIALFKFNLGFGLVVGLTAALIHQVLFVKYVDAMLFKEKFSLFGFIIGYVFRFMVLILAIASAFAWPDIVSVFSVIFGLFVLKLLLYVKELSLKKGENR